jgi:hypothetical protein
MSRFHFTILKKIQISEVEQLNPKGAAPEDPWASSKSAPCVLAAPLGLAAATRLSEIGFIISLSDTGLTAAPLLLE